MNLQRQFNFWLLLALGSSVSAFQQPIKSSDGVSSKPLDMTATLEASALLQRDIDISDVLAQTEAALSAAQKAIPASDSINKEMKMLSNMQTEMEKSLNSLSEEIFSASASESDQMLATAVVGSALGVVAGSPLVLGAALGVAGTHLLEGENGEQTRRLLTQAGKAISHQMQEAAAYAQEQIEKEEDLSKVPEKMLLAFQAKVNEEILEVQEESKHLMDTVKGTLESEEFKEELKAAPGKAFNAFKAFITSDEVKRAQEKAMQAIKDGLESEEMEALKTRATLAMQETAKK